MLTRSRHPSPGKNSIQLYPPIFQEVRQRRGSRRHRKLIENYASTTNWYRGKGCLISCLGDNDKMNVMCTWNFGILSGLLGWRLFFWKRGHNKGCHRWYCTFLLKKKIIHALINFTYCAYSTSCRFGLTHNRTPIPTLPSSHFRTFLNDHNKRSWKLRRSW